MKDYFVHLFRYNDWAHRRLLQAMARLEEPENAQALFTHVILSQQRWLERVRDQSTLGRPWFGPPTYDLGTCEHAWAASLHAWLDTLEAIGDDGLARTLRYQSSEGPVYCSTVQEVVIQLNNHSVHHRAQIARMIRQQGHTPPETDYIFFSRHPG